MIKYNNSNINDWNFDDSNIVKVYHNGAVCYYKVITSGDTSGQTPCFAVVSNISQYSDREFEDVFNQADEKWYKLNNLSAYEEYGVYGSGRNITYYNGKLTIDGDYEYQYSGNTWVNVGEISGSTNAYRYWMWRSVGEIVGDPSNFIQFSEFDLVVNGSDASLSCISAAPFGVTTGGTIETADKLFDNDTSTKYCADFSSYLNTNYILFDAQSAIAPTAFAMTTANDNSQYGRYPTSWVLLGSNTSTTNWNDGSWNLVLSGTCGNEMRADYTRFEYPIQGSTATLPDVSFVLNYNAKNYDSSTTSIPYTEGQLNTVNAVMQYGAAVVDHSEDGYISVTGDTRFVTTGGTVGIGRNNTQTGCTMTIVSKARTTSAQPILTSRGGTDGNQMNWMWRYPTDGIFLHGSSSYNTKLYSVDTTTNPIIASVKTYYDGGVKQILKDWTNDGGYSGNFGYGDYYDGGSMFCDYLTFNSEFWKGDFYWVYMSQEVLTDEQIQQVIAYNESGGGQPMYPVYYDEIQDPPNNLSFSSMTEAEDYQCPWVGMKATIAGSGYTFSGDSQSGYEWVHNSSRLPVGYTEVQYIENTDYASLAINYHPNQDTRVVTTMQAVQTNENPYGRFLGSGHWNCEDGTHGWQFDYEENPTGQLHISWGAVCGWDTYNVYGDYNVHTYDWNKNEFQIDNTLVASTTYQNFTCETNLGIFATILGTGAPPSIYGDGYKEYLRGKLYDFKIYDNGTLVADLVPCTNPNNVAGVYDIVNNVFYTAVNQGYYFVAGPTV